MSYKGLKNLVVNTIVAGGLAISSALVPLTGLPALVNAQEIAKPPAIEIEQPLKQPYTGRYSDDPEHVAGITCWGGTYYDAIVRLTVDGNGNVVGKSYHKLTDEKVVIDQKRLQELKKNGKLEDYFDKDPFAFSPDPYERVHINRNSGTDITFEEVRTVWEMDNSICYVLWMIENPKIFEDGKDRRLKENRKRWGES